MPPISARNCSTNGSYSVLPELGNLTECVTLDRCPRLLDSTYAPVQTTLYCGFHEEEQKMMICCPQELTVEPIVREHHLELHVT